MIRPAISFASKALLVWIAMLASSIIGAALLGMGDDGGGTDGPLTGGQAFLVVNGLHAIVLSVIANQASLRGLRLAALICVTLFFAQSFLLLMEAVYFQDSLKISMGFIVEGGLHVLIVAALTGGAIAALWRAKVDPSPIRFSIATFPIRLALIAAFYVLCYFGAGYFIAWQANEVQEYYSFGADIALVPLLLFQVVRGAMWGILAALLVWHMVGSSRTRSLIVGITFSILATAQLLYPNAIMPWEVRLPHLIEVGISNFIFGVIAALIVLLDRTQSPEKARRKQPH